MAKEPIRYENIKKSPMDKRDYRGLILSNKMKVLLISDPTTDKSAASLDVNIGYLSDPKELPGLAHFCEHMLFLGTEKYPKINDFSEYLSQNGGNSNASTDTDHTNYYFDVAPSNLEGALERFAQFFISPLFTESATEKEINAVHSEHEKNLASDNWRFHQVDKCLADPNHPYSKFGTGNKETLSIIPKEKGINVRDEVLKFYNTWYSANIMSLSVLGKETLDEQEKMVTELFSSVKNKDIEAPIFTEHPFNKEQFQTKLSIVPIEDLRNLHIIFPLPDMHEHFRSWPAYYWLHLLGHEGKGSLLSALRKKSWCNSIITGKRPSAKGFDFFTILISLTEEGILHVDDIITMIFQYIKFIKKEGPRSWIFNECKDIAEINFRFMEKLLPRDYVTATVHSLQLHPIEEILTAPYLMTEWRPDLINEVVEYFKPENIRVQVIGKMFENQTDSVEPWYGTKYKQERIPDELIEKWINVEMNDAFHLPEKNDFIPSIFDIKPIEKVEKFPTIVLDTPFLRLWCKQDDDFQLPKAAMIFHFVSPLSCIDPISINMTYMFVELFKDCLTEYAYPATLVGLKWELSITKYGLKLVLVGYSHHMDILLEKLLYQMMNFSVDKERFEIFKDVYMRNLRNFQTQKPYQHAAYYLEMLLLEQHWGKEELLNACSMLTAERVQKFIPLLLSKVHIEGLVHGNFTKSEVLEIGKLVDMKVNSMVTDLTPLLPKQLLLCREIELPKGCQFLYERENKYQRSSCTQLYFPTGMMSTENNILIELFNQIVSEPCFSELRTKQQLGYIVFSGIRRNNGVQGMRIVVQSNMHPALVEERIEEFLSSMKDYIKDMSQETFDKYKESLATQRLEKPKTLGAQSRIYWNEIAGQQYNFDRAEIEVAYLRTITHQQIIDFYNNYINAESPQRQKLSIHVISMAEGGAGTDKTISPIKNSVTEKASLIKDVLQFKSGNPLYPLLKPYISVPRKGTQQQSKL